MFDSWPIDKKKRLVTTGLVGLVCVLMVDNQNMYM